VPASSHPSSLQSSLLLPSVHIPSMAPCCYKDRPDSSSGPQKSTWHAPPPSPGSALISPLLMLIAELAIS
jgi:hypothetical protein